MAASASWHDPLPLDATSFDYAASPWPIRADLPEANRRAWARLARPGRWWTGAERVALAAEVRAARECALCAERKEALSPFGVDGTHDRAPGGEFLPEVAVEAVHRLVTDPGRLTRKWFEGLMADGLSAERYVEIVGIVTTVISIDAFHQGLGFELEALPAPEAGEPTQVRPDGLSDMGAYVPMIPANKATGPEADLYGGRPFTANVFAAMSLVPECVRQLEELGAAYYLKNEHVVDMKRPSGRAISRPQIEVIAARVSAMNECFY